MKFTFFDMIVYTCIPLYIFAFFAGGGLWTLIAGICLPTIICAYIYYCYKKLNDKLDIIEQQLKNEGKADKDSVIWNKASKK